jgi:hypothetical protein
MRTAVNCQIELCVRLLISAVRLGRMVIMDGFQMKSLTAA